MKRNVFLSLALAATFSAAAQHDRVISNWSQSQMIYNPGAVATGNSDMSFFANHRSQWLTVPDMGVGIRSNFVNGEFKIKEEGLTNQNNFGVGFSILSDQSGAANLTTLSLCSAQLHTSPWPPKQTQYWNCPGLYPAGLWPLWSDLGKPMGWQYL